MWHLVSACVDKTHRSSRGQGRGGFSTGAYFPVSRGVQPVLWLRLGVCCCQGLSGYYCGRGQASTISKARKTKSRGEVLGKGAARESGSAVSSPSGVLAQSPSCQTVFLHYTQNGPPVK